MYELSNQPPAPLIRFERILIVEDDKDFSVVLKDYLESIPFDVETAENGVEGLQKIMTSSFDVIVCDMMMPKLAGDMFYRAVERIRPDLCKRFIFITGYRHNPKIESFIRQINGTILAKPFHMDQLRETISFTLAQDKRGRCLLVS